MGSGVRTSPGPPISSGNYSHGVSAHGRFFSIGNHNVFRLCCWPPLRVPPTTVRSFRCACHPEAADMNLAGQEATAESPLSETLRWHTIRP